MAVIIPVTEELKHALARDLFAPPKWCTAFEVQVPDGAHDKLRFIDAVAVGLTAEREMHGFELKVSRADWLNELKKPEKSKPARQQLDRYWLVAGDESIYKQDEVPSKWGIIAPNKQGKLAIQREASRLTPRLDPPAPWPRAIMTAFLSRASGAWENRSSFVAKIERDAERRGFQKGRTQTQKFAHTKITVQTKTKLKYNPGRYNFDDGEPLNLP